MMTATLRAAAHNDMLRMNGAANLQAKAGEPGAVRRFQMDAYNGGPMSFPWSDVPVVVDIAGIDLTDKARPILKEHDPQQVVGHTTEITKEPARLVVAGIVSGAGDAAAEVVSASDKGFPWQASIGLVMGERVYIGPGQPVTVNAQTFTGPLLLVRTSTLSEVSFVALGADDSTAARMVAGADLPDAAEIRRAAVIALLCNGNPEIEDRAIREGWSTDKVRIALMRAGVPQCTGAIVRADQPHGNVLAAALLQAGGIRDLHKHVPEPVLDEADRLFRGRIGLQEFLLEAAQANGYERRSFQTDPEAAMRAAFAGFSTVDAAGLLGRVANKFLLEGFGAVDQAWRAIAAVRSVPNFKQVTSYRLTGATQYEKVGPSGEIDAGNLGEESFTNKAETYARLYAITRRDIINDDLGAFTTVPRMLGRGGALKLNDVFWTEFLANNASFYGVGRGNYLSGASSALSIDSLSAASGLFRNQVDSDGKPLGITPSILLVPTALWASAVTLYESSEIIVGALGSTSGSAREPNLNPHAGRYVPVVSPYLNNAGMVGNSATAWWLLADPNVLPLIEVAFLNGQDVPTIEQAEADFATLGIQMRGYHDFGVKKQDYRAAVKSAGV